MAKFDTAVVIGGSVAGLLAARVLSDHFGEVTIIDRDTFPTEIAARNGVPHMRQGHILLARGNAILETLFPGFEAALKADGAARFDWGSGEYVGLLPGGWVRTGATGRTITQIVSRMLLEHHIRARVRALPNMRVIERADVSGLATNADKRTVRGVNYTARDDHAERTLRADLVIDCSGRNSKTPGWLTALGYEAPEESHVNSYVGYATRWYSALPGCQWKTVLLGNNPIRGNFRGGGILAIENGGFTVTLQGVNKDYPPTDEEGFLEFAKSLENPLMYELIKNGTPAGPIYGFRYAGSSRRHYEKLARFPDRFLVMGDAACSFNPIYGQGMTVAAVEAEALAGQLTGAAALDGFNARFQKLIPALTRDAWTLATGEDLRYAATETTGAPPNFITRMAQRYSAMVMDTMPYDREVTATFIEVLHLIKPPTALSTPGIVGRVLKSRLVGARGTPTAPPVMGWQPEAVSDQP